MERQDLLRSGHCKLQSRHSSLLSTIRIKGKDFFREKKIGERSGIAVHQQRKEREREAIKRERERAGGIAAKKDIGVARSAVGFSMQGPSCNM